MIESLDPNDLADLIPLCADVQKLHSQAMPERFCADIPDDTLLAFFTGVMRQDHHVLVWRDGAQAVGYLMFAVEERAANPFRRAERVGKLHHISVLESHRRRGIASALIDEMKERLRASGVTQWAVTYWCFNTASAAVMAKAGAMPLHVMAGGRL